MTTFWETGATAAAFGAALFAAPAMAQERHAEGTEVAMEVVFYHDLDLSTQRDRRALRSRLRDAARYVCGMDIRVSGSRFASADAQQCYAERLEWIDTEVAQRAERQARRG